MLMFVQSIFFIVSCYFEMDIMIETSFCFYLLDCLFLLDEFVSLSSSDLSVLFFIFLLFFSFGDV